MNPDNKPRITGYYICYEDTDSRVLPYWWNGKTDPNTFQAEKEAPFETKEVGRALKDRLIEEIRKAKLGKKKEASTAETSDSE